MQQIVPFSSTFTLNKHVSALDGILRPKPIVLKVKVEENGTICYIIDGLYYT
jgi:hypothetical protein